MGCRGRRWGVEVVGRVSNLFFFFVRGISGTVGRFCGLTDPPK